MESTRQYFEEGIPDLLNNHADRVSHIDAIYEFQITGNGGGTWALDLKSTPATINEQSAENPDCTIIMNDEDFLKMINGELKPQMAFLSGKLKVTGNMGLALKLTALF